MRDEGDRDDSDRDPLHEEAVLLVRSTGKASVSWVQRRLGIAYSRAERMVARMEKDGIVSPPSSGGPRTLLDGTSAAFSAVRVQERRQEDREMLATSSGCESVEAASRQLAREDQTSAEEGPATKALRNCLALASRHRHELWAEHIRRFCAEGGVTATPLRGDAGGSD